MREPNRLSETAHRTKTDETSDAEIRAGQKMLTAAKPWLVIMAISYLYTWIVDVEGLLPAAHQPLPIQVSSAALLIVALLLSAIVYGRVFVYVLVIGHQTYQSLYTYWAD